MPMWRCPHCGTPQAETARCWVCRRSSTACGTCRYFRRSVAGSLGYCGLDRRRQPLAGDEIRPCWEAWPGRTEAPATTQPAIQPTVGEAAPSRAARLEFVEVGDRPEADLADATAAPSEAGSASPPFDPGTLLQAADNEPGWSLWGDPDR